MNEKISVIVPVYNVEKYLDKCLESIVHQTYRNLEIILVDDGSSDNCPAMCDEWAGKDKRIKVIHKENGGLSSARNAGLDFATGEYIVFVDSDDWLDTDAVEKLLRAAVENRADIVASGFYFENESGTSSIQDLRVSSFENEDIAFALLTDEIRPEVCSKLYSARLIGKLRFDESMKYAEDLPFNFNVMLKAKKLFCMAVSCYHYYQRNAGSITSSYISAARAESWKMFNSFYEQCSGREKLKTACTYRFTIYTFGILNRVIPFKEYRKKYFNEISNSLIRYKKEIMQNSLISKKHKCSLMLLAFNRYLYLAVYWLVFRF